MNNYDLAHLPTESLGIEIGIVERETGGPKDTLRIWERRYAFPTPIRSSTGRREYSGSDLIKLRLLKRLIDRRHRPRTIVSQPADALRALLENSTAGVNRATRPQSGIQLSPELLNDEKLDELLLWIASAFEERDSRSFILDCAGPLCQQVGEPTRCRPCR